MKKIIISLIVIFLIGGLYTAFPKGVKAKVHTSHHTSVHSSSHSSKSHISTPKSSTLSSGKSKSSTSSHTTSSKATSSSSGKSYTTTKSSTGRTTVTHETVKPKTSESIVNNNPTYYKNYSTTSRYPLTNSIFTYYMISSMFNNKKDVSEQDVAKALEEKGYSEEETKQILDEAKTEEKENKPFYDGWKWYNWAILLVAILAVIGLIISIITM